MSELEDLERIFSSTLKSTDHGDENGRKKLYKNRSNSKTSQEERRKSLLLLQKEKRQKFLNETRKLDENSYLKRKISDVWEQEIDFIQQQKSEREEWFKQTHRYKNSLMLSEWLLEIPDNFLEWIMVPCPKGQRTLLISRMGCATSYSKHGSPINTYKCQLPRNTILDCIFCWKTNNFYVLDVQQWNGHCLRNCQTDFRFFWLESKLMENPELSVHSDRNECVIKSLVRSKCDKSSLAASMCRYPFFENNEPELDGLLFYHAEVFYTAGSTPLVGWLKPFMLPELLSVTVPQQYLAEKPDCCNTVDDYINWFNLQLKKNNPRRRHGRNKMMKTGDELKTPESDLTTEMASENVDDDPIGENTESELANFDPRESSSSPA